MHPNPRQVVPIVLALVPWRRWATGFFRSARPKPPTAH